MERERFSKRVGVAIAAGVLLTGVASPESKHDDLSQQLETRLRKYEDVSLVVDFKTGKTLVKHSADKKIFPASTVKAVIAYAALELEEQGVMDLDRKVVIEHEVGGTTTPAYEPGGATRAGKSFKKSTLVHRMIKYSDNTASNQMLQEVGVSRLKDIIEDDLDMENTHIEKGYFDPNTKKVIQTTPRDMVNFLHEVYEKSQGGKDPAATQLVKYMKEGSAIRFNGKIDKDLSFAGKHGSAYNGQHQVGIVFDKKNAYGVAIYGYDFKENAASYYAGVINTFS